MGDTLMSGYAGDEQLTQKVLVNDTITTSDYGKINEEGMLILYGREDDVINIGGYKVAPTEVENVAMSIPQIKDCICIPANHNILGTVLKLLYVSDNAPTAKEIANYIKTKLENYKVPFFYEQTDSIKRTYNGKTDRKYYKENFK
jgi:acyl-coenzyme A synthetase/AMP-(fatty) acid ligase